ncbi:limonene-1,2-epoxide hydrolase family protein [Hyphococcus lacteus]|uniref:Nuclear transport factor 2 family protein n=1 Tax=Hyphococcus lacteus TaxID=3143536 RepID=A0ABV3Z3L1_9PROT
MNITIRRPARALGLSLAASLALVGCSAAGDVKAASSDGAGEEEIAVVMDMVDAWNNTDWEKVVDLFADDGVLHSMMIDPITGKESIRARINHMGEGLESITLHIKNIGVGGNVVFIERVDEFVYNGHAGEVPVAGVIEIVDGKVKVWREYYDRDELLSEMGVAVDFDSEAR